MNKQINGKEHDARMERTQGDGECKEYKVPGTDVVLRFTVDLDSMMVFVRAALDAEAPYIHNGGNIVAYNVFRLRGNKPWDTDMTASYKAGVARTIDMAVREFTGMTETGCYKRLCRIINKEMLKEGCFDGNRVARMLFIKCLGFAPNSVFAEQTIQLLADVMSECRSDTEFKLAAFIILTVVTRTLTSDDVMPTCEFGGTVRGCCNQRQYIDSISQSLAENLGDEAASKVMACVSFGVPLTTHSVLD